MKSEEIRAYLKKLYDDRKKDSIKSDFGRTLLIGGSSSYPGAILIASDFSYLSGNGYTAIAVPESIRVVVQSRANPTLVFENQYGKENSFAITGASQSMDKYDSILFGNGVADNEENLRFLVYLIENYSGKLIIDATGLMLLAKNPDVLLKKNKASNILLTPHLKEGSALIDYELKDRNPHLYLNETIIFAKKYQVNLLLKSYESVLVLANGAIFESEYDMTPIFARAGSGDGLAGLLAGYLAYADKIIGYENTVLFADALFHYAGLMTEQEKGLGTTSVMDVYETIKNYRNI